MTRSLRLFLPAGLATALAVAALVLFLTASAQDTDLTTRAFAPMLASDGVAQDALPQPDPSYCAPSAGTQPPDVRISGALTIGGSPAPAGTVVQVFLDGVAGPAAASRTAGSYTVDFWVGTGSCSNQLGRSISLVVNGQTVATGKIATLGLIAHNVTIP